MNDPDLLALLDAFPALNEQGGTLFIRDSDRGVANLFDVPETDALMDLVTAVPRLREALLKARTTVERLTRENDGLSARLTETRREHDAEVTLLHDEIAEVRAENDRLRTARYEDAAGVLAAARADAATWNARATALETERDTARGDLDAVRRVLAEGLGADAKESDLDALALAARACEVIDRLEAVGEGSCDALTKAGAQYDDLARGETAPSLDAIRAHNAGWLWTLVDDDGTDGGFAALTLAGDEDRGVWGVGDVPRTFQTCEAFAAWASARRWWRVASDGSLAVAEVDAVLDVG